MRSGTKSGWHLPMTAVGVGFLCNALVGLSDAQSWIKTSAPNTNWVSIACSTDGTKLIAAAGQADFGVAGPLFLSKDSGLTWNQTSAPTVPWSCVACSSDGEKIFASAVVGQGEKSFWSSTNGGLSWNGYVYPSNTYLLGASADGETVLAAGGPVGFLASSLDAGKTWTPYALPVSTSPAGIVVSSDGTRQILCDFDGMSTFLWMYTSTGSGKTWTQNPGPQNSSFSRIAFAGATEGNSLVAVVDLSIVNLPGLFTSSDWGQTWDTHDQLLNPLSVAPFSGGTIACSSDGSKLMGSFSTVYGSTNSGVSWYPTGAPIVGRLACSADGRRFYVAGAGGGIYVFDSTLNSEPTRLSIVRTPRNLLLSWPATSNGMLEQASILGPTNWAPVPTAPMVTNSEYQLFVAPASSQLQFFRLKGL